MKKWSLVLSRTARRPALKCQTQWTCRANERDAATSRAEAKRFVAFPPALEVPPHDLEDEHFKGRLMHCQ